MGKFSRWVLGIGVCTVIGAGAWAWYTYLEGEKPSLQIGQDIAYIGSKTDISFACRDKRQGVREILVELIQKNKPHVLSEVLIPDRGTHLKNVVVTVDPASLGLEDGKAILRFSANDHSLRKNSSSLTIEVVIDTTPPQIFPVSSSHYINPGGSCLAVYRISESVVQNGIKVDDTFFPAYRMTDDADPTYIVLFALPPDSSAKASKIGIFAKDTAGNEVFSSLPCHIRSGKFRRDTMRIGTSFLEKKMPEFRNLCPDLKADASVLDIFIHVNEKLRTRNSNEVMEICKNSEPRKLWDGAFLRMSNAATMAGFGDQRIYVFEGKNISSSVHLGVDLASTVNAPVEASNSGIVKYCGNIGIYGNTVIIDHGFGLFSFYAHLSSIAVNPDDPVAKGQIIGKSGRSGLAGGDHLHFGIIAGKKFVNPQEWWDTHWIKDNILTKATFSGHAGNVRSKI
ncbi:MAG: M23 family metallopeptidase [Syntrophales bacterium]|jgi:murein DD-endopeptidase MepM/ murein hydrolase activator NlpD|nr:M23 family metallopeptidase [Syntrophales bacterium]MDY0043282.1 M23 family metallopeptidase [Syntrophales bacterium]